MRIGYGAYSKDFSVPGDRRRFAKYAKERGIKFEFANPKNEYDFVYLTYNSDIPAWIEKKKQRGDKLKLVFELIDSYLAEPVTTKTRLRGISRFVANTDSRPTLDFQNSIKEICSIADGIVCSTIEQKKMIAPLNKNIHVSLDIFEGDITTTKTNFNKSQDKLKLVWEGQPYTLNNVLIIKDVLNELSQIVELHIVTDSHFYRFYKKYFKRETKQILKEITCKKIFHNWEKSTFSKIITNCDLAIIPINLADDMQKGKPENKLMLLWKMGMPVITSQSPAYKRAMDHGEIEMYCKNLKEDWVNKIKWYYAMSAEERKTFSMGTQNFANQHYSENKLMNSWDKILKSVNVELDSTLKNI